MNNSIEIELVTIGNELLSGSIIDTNSAFIGKTLFDAGYSVSRKATLSDRKQEIKRGLFEALERSDVVIATGGLGPTLDDLTKQATASLLNINLAYRQDVANELYTRFSSRPETFRPIVIDQATIPDGAIVLPNRIGTAPGLVMKTGEKLLILLPGVPDEMKVLFVEQVLPLLQTHFPLQMRIFRKVACFFELSEFKVDPLLRGLEKKFPEILFSIYPSSWVLRVHLCTFAKDSETASKTLSEPLSILEKTFSSHLYHSESGTIEEAVQRLFCDNKWTLSLAESCTGGAAAKRLTELPGSSQYFSGSIVCYSNMMKTKFLGVPENLLFEKGAVSEEVVKSMVEGLLCVTKSDFGLAVTGIAGPTGGSLEKPVGTVFCSVCRKGETPYVWKLECKGTRGAIIERSVNSLFGTLLKYAKPA